MCEGCGVALTAENASNRIERCCVDCALTQPDQRYAISDLVLGPVAVQGITDETGGKR